MIEKPININTHTTFADTLSPGLPARWSSEPLSEDDLILEAATLEDIELAYLGNEILAESDGAMFEAISTKRLKLAATMRAFIRVLNRGLNGTDIKAGTDEAGEDENGLPTIGGAHIGKVRRVANIPVMTAQIPLTDGQTTSIIFHSPTADNGRVKNDDTLVAFQFLLNKRDVTHVVAPIGGRDVTLNQVCQVLSNLIERNSAKFQKAKERQAKVKADIEGYLNEADKLGDERSTLIEQVESAQNGLAEKRDALASLQDRLQSQKSLNADLEAKRNKLLAAKENPTPERAFTNQLRVIKNGLSMDGLFTLSNGAVVKYTTADAAGGPESFVTIESSNGSFRLQAKDMQAKSMADAATKLLKAYRENNADKYKVAVQPVEPSPQPEPELDAVGQFKYALQLRPASLGTIPDGNTAILPRPENADDPYYDYMRHGAVTYDRKLTDEEIKGFDLLYLPGSDELQSLAEQIANGRMKEYAAQYLEQSEEDPATFKAQVKLFFRKEFSTVAYPLGNEQNFFLLNVLAELKKVAEADVSNGASEDAPPEQQPADNEPAETTTTGTEEVSEADQEANKALDYIKSVPSQFNSRNLAEISAELDHVQGAANALIAASRFDENETFVEAAVDHLIKILAEVQQGGA
ncbi:head protein [Enterobacter hormaechei]|uniref:antirestriction phage head protein DarA n=1 Tax=Enterobacter hormaechei TaxID=158836 RepID=UPI003D6FF799